MQLQVNQQVIQLKNGPLCSKKNLFLGCNYLKLNLCMFLFFIILIFLNHFFFILFSAYGNLTVRGLLDTINQCLKEFDFPDPYLTVRFN